jgi:hypothetical protein
MLKNRARQILLMLKVKARQTLLMSTRFRRYLTGWRSRRREKRRVEHLISVIFRGGMMRV